jgi:RNA recognition motif-containing protein
VTSHAESVAPQKAIYSLKKYTVFVKNLPLETHDREVHKYFEENQCNVKKVTLHQDNLGNLTGQGQVDVGSQKDLEAALAVHGSTFMGKKLEVNEN